MTFLLHPFYLKDSFLQYQECIDLLKSIFLEFFQKKALLFLIRKLGNYIIKCSWQNGYTLYFLPGLKCRDTKEECPRFTNSPIPGLYLIRSFCLKLRVLIMIFSFG